MQPVVGVLRGGTSSEYDLSLKTGAAVLDALEKTNHNTRDIFIDKAGVWHSRGVPIEPARAVHQVDVVLNGLHGGIGEDGTVQRILSRAGVPFTGSSALPAALSLNKIQAREHFRRAGLRIPRGAAFSYASGLSANQMAHAVFDMFGPPYIVKPAREGASFGIAVAPTVIELPVVLAITLDAHDGVVVEEFVRGEEATVGIIENFRGEDLYALPPAHVEFPDTHAHIHFDHHHAGSLRYNAPSHFSFSEKQALADTARAAHRALGLSHFSRSDFILAPRGPYLLEVNAIPGLYAEAALPHMLESVGSSVPEFLTHSLALARS